LELLSGRWIPKPQEPNPTDEEQIDRRAHWAQWALAGIVAATAWCVKLEMNSSNQAEDAKQYKRDMKATLKEQDNKGDDLEHRLIILETIQACRDGIHDCK
jgi:hypothetical protein